MEMTVYEETKEITQEQYEYILNHIKYEKLKSLVEKQEDKKSIDVEMQVERFLSLLKPNTEKTYRPIIEKFVNNIPHILDVDPIFVDDYVKGMSEVYASATVRLTVSALSSFYSKLKRWGFIDDNPFSKCFLPEQERSRELVVPTEEEINIIKDYFTTVFDDEDSRKKESGRKMLAALTLMIDLGLRVGALKSLRIENGVYETKSKGKIVRGKVPNHVLEYLEDIEFDDFSLLNKPMIQFNLNKALTKLAEADMIKDIYHAHSFRHYYAVKTYMECKDIYKVSRLLNHSSVGVTQRYLESLELEV